MTDPIHIAAAGLTTRARLAAYAIWDNLTQPRPMHRDEVPWHGEALTTDWLSSVVAASVPGAQALDIRIVGGDDGSSARRIIAVDWNEAGQAANLPQRLFTKSTPALAMRLSAGKSAPAEGYFLTELRPDVDIEAPFCLYSARDPISGRSFHLMDDLTTTRGATFCKAHDTLNREQAIQMVDTIATLHGTFHNDMARLDTARLRTYESFFHAAARNGIQGGHDQAMARAESIIPAAVTAGKDRIWDAAVASLALHEQSPRTVIHSDVHLGNWYVTRDGRMGLCDWARVCRGYWGRDLAYALMTALAVEDRRAWEHDLIARYCETFSARSKVERSVDEGWDAYRRQACLALLMWTPTLCPPPTLPEMQPEAVSLAMIERITTAMDDHDVLSLT